jgi:membrane protease YdiL (CAAX protease family)
MKESPKLHIQSWAIIAVVITLTIILMILSFPLRDAIRKSDLLWVIYGYLPILAGLILTLFLNRRFFRFFSCRPETSYWYRYLYFLLLISGFVLFSLSLFSQLKQPPILVQLTEISDFTRNFSDLFYLKYLLLAPVFEEILFRGIILEGFLSKYSVKKSVLLSSLVFAVLHLNVLRMFHAFILGIFTGWYYSKTRNLLSCMIIHFLNNGIYIILLKPATDKFKSLPIPKGNGIFNFEHFWLTFLWSLLSIIISLIALKRTMKTVPAENQTVKS